MIHTNANVSSLSVKFMSDIKEICVKGLCQKSFVQDWKSLPIDIDFFLKSYHICLVLKFYTSFMYVITHLQFLWGCIKGYRVSLAMFCVS